MTCVENRSVAAKWLATTPRTKRWGDDVEQLRYCFGLSVAEALDVISEAALIRARAL